jgi:hypothetical protein
MVCLVLSLDLGLCKEKESGDIHRKHSRFSLHTSIFNVKYLIHLSKKRGKQLQTRDFEEDSIGVIHSHEFAIPSLCDFRFHDH